MNDQINVEDIERHCAELATALDSADLSPVLAAVRPIAMQAHRDNFTSSASPDGATWQDRKRVGDGHPLLIDTGDLLQAATGGGAGTIVIIVDREMTLGVDGATIPYAAIHNYGGTLHWYNGEQRGADMPQREFLGMSELRLIEADRVVTEGVFRIVFGAGGP